MEAVSTTLRHAVRNSRRGTGSTLTAVVILALGVGTTTLVTSLARTLALAPLPYPDPDRLVLLWSALTASGYDRAPISGPELDDFRQQASSIAELASIWSTTAALVEDDRPTTLRLGLVTWSFLSLLGAEPPLGRLFEPSEEGQGAPPAIVLSDDLWQRRFGGDASVLGRTLRIDGGWGFGGGTYTVVGVLPPGFRLCFSADAGVPPDPDAFIPFGNDLAHSPRGTYYLRTIGRLAPAVDFSTARSQVAEIGAKLSGQHAEYAGAGRSFELVSLHADAVAAARPAVVAVLLGAGFLLLVACTNIAGLQLVRVADRQTEIALRSALGASSRRLAAMLLSESLLLAAAGGLLGLFGAWLGVDLLGRLLPAQLPRTGYLTIDPVVLAVSIAATLGSGLLFGVLPAARVLRSSSGGDLRRNLAGDHSARLRRMLVVGEIGAGVVLLFGAGVSLQSFLRLRAVDPGFSSSGVLTARLNLPRNRYSSPERIAAFAEELERELEALPGVEAAGAINQLPLDDLPNWSTGYTFHGAPQDAAFEADARVVSSGYFDAVGVELIAGRGFRSTDGPTGRPVVIVDRSLAERAWPGRSPIGEEISLAVWNGERFAESWAEVIGVVEHVRHRELGREVREQLFVPFSLGARNQMAIAVRSSADPGAVAGAVRRAIAAVDPELATSELLPLSTLVDAAAGVPRLTTLFALMFGSLSLLLAGVGLYGLVSYGVARRRAELGLRAALGARPRQLQAMVVRQGLHLCLGGLVLGGVGTVAVAGALGSFLYQVDPLRERAVLAVPVLLVVVTLLASWLPARRAAHSDPMVSLRPE